MSSDAVTVSVVVPVLDDGPGVARTIHDLHGQTLPVEDFEVVVVDNGSSDGTLASAREAASSGPARVQVLTEREHRTSYGARNRGIDAATGELCSFLDADMGVPADYLAMVVAAMADLDYAGCPVDIEVGRPTVAALHNRLFGFPVAQYLARGWAPTCCLTVRRDVIDAVGAFDPTLASGGDAAFGRRVADDGYRQGLITTTSLRHPARDRVGALTRKTVRTARGKARLARTDDHHAAVVRGYASWPRLRPLNPVWVRRELAAAGLPRDPRRVLGVVALKSWLDVVRLVAAWRGSRRG